MDLDHIRPLNPALHGALTARFGSVRIANEGQNLLSTGGLNGQRTIVSSGEYYRIGCPFCSETRHRLWINHMFGVPNHRGFPDTSLAHCFRKECLRNNPARRQELEQMIFGLRNRNQRAAAVRILRGDNNRAPLGNVTAPGEILGLNALSGDHRCIQYITARGYDPAYLQQQFDVGYCAFAPAPFGLAIDRLYIPIKMHGELVGWQCRYCGIADWRETPKYFGLRGMAKSRMLYGFDAARPWRFVIVVEGPSDAWRIGAPAVALLGKSMSPAQQQLLQSVWPGCPIVVVLDGEAHIEMEGLIADLARNRRNPIVRVRLPDGRDPDSYSRDAIWDLIHAAAFEQGVTLSAYPSQ